MNELNQSSPIDQIVSKIYEEMSVPDLSFPRVVDYLRDLRIKEEYQSLSNTEYYDIVGETFKLNPDIFMKHIYGDRRFYQYNNSEMQKYILEKISLYEGEQILFEDSGKIIQEGGGGINTVSGRIYVTNYRIIAQGTLSTKKEKQVGGGWGLMDLVRVPMELALTGNRAGRKSKDELIEGSTYQELPCYGYQFKTKNHSGLKKKKDGIKYELIAYRVGNISKTSNIQQTIALNEATRTIRIILPYKKAERTIYLFNLLCKNANQIVDNLRELHEMGFNRIIKRRKILGGLKSEEYQHLSDSDYLYIVKETYKLDPDFFMTSIYPKMMSWKYSKFISVKDMKEEIKSLIDKLSKESGA